MVAVIARTFARQVSAVKLSRSRRMRLSFKAAASTKRQVQVEKAVPAVPAALVARAVVNHPFAAMAQLRPTRFVTMATTMTAMDAETLHRVWTERPTCAGGDTQGVRRCEAGAWVEETCEGENICEDGACRPPRVCEDGVSRCSDGDGSAARERCVDGQWTAPELCQSGMVCVRGACEMACDEGLTRCAARGTNAIERCVNSIWVADRACGVAETCRLGQCVGVAMMCQDGQRRCSPEMPNVPQTCRDGNWANGLACARDEACQDGECIGRRCLEGTTRCADNNLETCDANGAWAPERCAEGCGTPEGGEAQCMCNDRLPGECTEGRLVFAINCVNGFEQSQQCMGNCTVDARGEARCSYGSGQYLASPRDG